MSDTANAPRTAEPPRADHGTLAHVMPVPMLLAVFFALMALTVLTVTATWVDLGGWTLAIAMGIATIKASLVALYFMHLRYDHPFNGLLFAVALAFLATFIALTLLDTLEYQPDVNAVQQNL